MHVKTAGRPLDLFEAFAREGKPLSLSQLARAINAPVSSCFGIVRTLQARGYLYEVKARGGFYPTKLLFEHSRATPRFRSAGCRVPAPGDGGFPCWCEA